MGSAGWGTPREHPGGSVHGEQSQHGQSPPWRGDRGGGDPGVEGSPGWGRRLPLSLSAWLAVLKSRSAHSRSEFSGNRSRGAVGGGQRGKWSPASGSQGGRRGPSPPGPPAPGGTGPGCAATEPPARVVELVPGKRPCIVGGLLLSTSWDPGSHEGGHCSLVTMRCLSKVWRCPCQQVLSPRPPQVATRHTPLRAPESRAAQGWRAPRLV